MHEVIVDKADSEAKLEKARGASAALSGGVGGTAEVGEGSTKGETIKLLLRKMGRLKLAEAAMVEGEIQRV